MSDQYSGTALYAFYQGTYVLKLTGEVRAPMCVTLDAFVESIFRDERMRAVIVDLTDICLIDSTALGLIAKIAVNFKARSDEKPVLISTCIDTTRVLESMGFEQVFDIVKALTTSIPEKLDEIPVEICAKSGATEKVLEAHRILMNMNKKNHDTFKEVVEALEFDKLCH